MPHACKITTKVFAVDFRSDQVPFGAIKTDPQGNLEQMDCFYFHSYAKYMSENIVMGILDFL